MNYAEASIEHSSSTGEQLKKGKKALNAVRKRAAHKDEIPLTIENVRKERFVEFAFENRKRPTSPETVRFRGDFGRFYLI